MVTIGQEAPPFSLRNLRGETVNLTDYRGHRRVVLVLNRGLWCPYCRKHMARLRTTYPDFAAREAVIVAVGPDSRESFRRTWLAEDLQFVGLPDPERKVLRLYGQQVRLARLGRLPAVIIIDKTGIVRYVHYGGSMMDIPPIESLLRALDRIIGDSRGTTPPGPG